MISEILPGETEALAAALHAIALEDTITQDYGLPAIRRVLCALLARFPVYRIYAGRGGPRAADAAVMEAAVATARMSLRPADHALLHLLAGWLGGTDVRGLPPAARARRLRAMVRFQQLTAPAAAKSVEDTAFYRYGRLLSRNEVGSDPAVFARLPEAFHAAMAERRRRLAAGAARHRDARPQARRGRAGAARGAERTAGAVDRARRGMDAADRRLAPAARARCGGRGDALPVGGRGVAARPVCGGYGRSRGVGPAAGGMAGKGIARSQAAVDLGLAGRRL